jgi:hypothetical protein
VGSLTTAQGNYKYAVVAVEYFTKWIEAKPLVNIASAGLKRFFRQNIICHFRVPRKITIDNAKQFGCHIFKDFFAIRWGSKQPSHQYIILGLMGSGKSTHIDIYSHKKDIRRPAKGQVGRGIAKSSMES